MPYSATSAPAMATLLGDSPASGSGCFWAPLGCTLAPLALGSEGGESFGMIGGRGIT